MNWKRLNRNVHYWISIGIALPLLIIIGSGIFLQLKKESSWIQPTTQDGSTQAPTLSYDRLLAVTKTIPECEVNSWEDIDRLDVRPSKGVIKVRCKNRWEAQIDAASGEVLQVSYRRSDLIESIHDGSFFHDRVKLWIFLPASVLLFLMWITGIVLFLIPFQVKRNAKQKRALYTAQKRAQD